MSKIRDLKEKKENNISVVDIVSRLCPDGKSKYVDTLLRLMKNDFDLSRYSPKKLKEDISYFLNIPIEELDKLSHHEIVYLFGLLHIFDTKNLQTFQMFCEYNERKLIPQNDVSTYKHFHEIKDVTKFVRIKEQEKEMEKEVRKLYEDETWLVLRPLSYRSSLKYGASTKWCTASSDSSGTWNSYSKDGILIYTINKKTDYKLAVYYKLTNDSKITYWNTIDKSIDVSEIEIPDNVHSIILSEIETYPVPNSFFALETSNRQKLKTLETVEQLMDWRHPSKKVEFLDSLDPGRFKDLMQSKRHVSKTEQSFRDLQKIYTSQKIEEENEIEEKTWMPITGGTISTMSSGYSFMPGVDMGIHMAIPVYPLKTNVITPLTASIWNPISMQTEVHCYGTIDENGERCISERYEPILEDLMYYGNTEIPADIEKNPKYMRFISQLEQIKRYYDSLNEIKQSTIEMRNHRDDDDLLSIISESMRKFL